MRITVQLTPGASQRARGKSSATAHAAVLPWLGRPLHPMHPDTTDPALSSFFTVDVADGEEAARLLTRLQNDRHVDAAYIKPDDELPSL